MLTLKVDFIVLSEEEANRLWRIEPDVLFPQIIDDRILDKTKLGQICLVLQFFCLRCFLYSHIQGNFFLQFLTAAGWKISLCWLHGNPTTSIEILSVPLLDCYWQFPVAFRVKSPEWQWHDSTFFA